MKLYIETESKNREYLPNRALTRMALAHELGSTNVNVGGKPYHVNDVKAEAFQLVLRSALIIAGSITLASIVAIMVFAHWPAIAFVSAAGGVLTGIYFASKWQQNEDQQVKTFNRSRIHSEPSPHYAQAA